MKANNAGKFISAAGAIETVTLGYAPSYVKVNNVTSNITYEYWNDGTNIVGILTTGSTGVITQADASIVKTANGFTVAAATLTTSDVVYYTAQRLY